MMMHMKICYNVLLVLLLPVYKYKTTNTNILIFQTTRLSCQIFWAIALKNMPKFDLFYLTMLPVNTVTGVKLH